MTKEEYDKFITPDEHERRTALVKKGIESAKLQSAKKRAVIERAGWKRKRIEVTEKYDI